jgi:hypothetical protein
MCLGPRCEQAHCMISGPRCAQAQDARRVQAHRPKVRQAQDPFRPTIFDVALVDARHTEARWCLRVPMSLSRTSHVHEDSREQKGHILTFVLQWSAVHVLVSRSDLHCRTNAKKNSAI